MNAGLVERKMRAENRGNNGTASDGIGSVKVYVAIACWDRMNLKSKREGHLHDFNKLRSGTAMVVLSEINR